MIPTLAEIAVFALRDVIGICTAVYVVGAVAITTGERPFVITVRRPWRWLVFGLVGSLAAAVAFKAASKWLVTP